MQLARWTIAIACVGCGSSSSAKLDGAVGHDAPGDAITHTPDAGPIVAPADTWTWEPLPGTTCGNGTVAGVGINPPAGGPGAHVLIYFEGGGACYDDLSCFTAHTAVNIGAPYTAVSLAADISSTFGAFQLFSRDPLSPFADATFVFVPYCTGDLHAGTATKTYASGTVHHTGATNAAIDAAVLALTAPAATQIWVTGSDAGGYGAMLDLPLFTAAWPHAQVDVLADSAPMVPVIANYATWQASWDLQFPAGCTTCATSFPAAVDALVAAHPTTRFALDTTNDDTDIELLLGYAQGALATPLGSLVSTQYGHATTHAFVGAGNIHDLLGEEGTFSGPGGASLTTWVNQWATGDAAWTTMQ